jgi:hypothetical protein
VSARADVLDCAIAACRFSQHFHSSFLHTLLAAISVGAMRRCAAPVIVYYQSTRALLARTIQARPHERLIGLLLNVIANHTGLTVVLTVLFLHRFEANDKQNNISLIAPIR